MDKKFFITALIVGIYYISTLPASAQAGWMMDNAAFQYPSPERLRSDVDFLADSLTAGRGRGHKGHAEVTFFLAMNMRWNGLKPLGDGFVLGNDTNDGKGGVWNVAGMIEGGKEYYDKPRYIIVGANYDGIGTIGEKFYPGADANASGAAALIEIARTFRLQRDAGRTYRGNVIFVAFDGYTDGRCGASAFWKMLSQEKLLDPVTGQSIKCSDIVAMIDMDQIGCTLAPVTKGLRNYLIAIGEDSLPSYYGGLLERCNRFYGCSLNLYHSYYGSAKFTDAFYRLGDRKIFIEHKIPTIYFTSGITEYNNTVNDRPETLNYDVFARRTALIFRYIEKLL